MPDTHKEIDADTISLIPKHIPIPNANLDDQLKQAATDLIKLLKRKKKPLPGPPISNNTIQGLKQLAQIFQYNTFDDQIQTKTISNVPTESQKHTTKTKKKLSDEEFNKILQNIPKRNTTNTPKSPKQIQNITKHSTSEGATKIPSLISNKHKISEGAEYSNTYTPKTIKSRSQSKPIAFPRLYQNFTPGPTIHQSAQHLSVTNKQSINHIFENRKKISLDKLMEKDSVWVTSLAKELGRVMQGVGG